MRVLTSSVLVMQAIVLGLAIPVAVVAGGQPRGVGWLLAGLAVGCLALLGMVGRRSFVALGWGMQVAVIACGFFEPMLFLLGAVFAALWWTAVRLGRRSDAAQSAAGQPDGG